MEAVIAAALQAFGLVIVALIGFYGARKLGIGQNQDKLVNTLKDLIDAQDAKIANLEAARVQDSKRIEQLELRVAELTELTVKQALENDRLRAEKPTRARKEAVAPEGGE